MRRIGLPTGESGSSYAFERATPFTVPKLLQEKIIQSFEASKYVGAVVKPMEGIAADYQLLIDLRSFQITGAPTAHVEFAAKILLGRTHRRIAFLRRGPAKHVSAAGGGRPASCEVRAGVPEIEQLSAEQSAAELVERKAGGCRPASTGRTQSRESM